MCWYKNAVDKLRKQRSYQITFFVISMIVILGGFILTKMSITKVIEHRFNVIEDANVIKYIDDVCINGERLEIRGWSFYKGYDSKKTDIQVFIKSVDEEDIVWLDVKKVKREEIGLYYNDGNDYCYTGFEAYTNLDEIDVMSKKYEIFIKLTYNEQFGDLYDEGVRKQNKTVSTGRYIEKGEITVSSSRDKIFSRTESETVNKVIKDGHLLCHRADQDVFIMQYDKKLYWIAGEQFKFEEDGLTYIQYQLDTTRVDRLPKERIENGWNWDNQGFVFEEHELQENTSPYRVAVNDIPTDYPVTYFWTGYFSTDWVWKETINIDVCEIIEN